MRQVVAATDDRPRHSGGECTLSKQTPRPAAVASPVAQVQTPGTEKTLTSARVVCRRHGGRRLFDGPFPPGPGCDRLAVEQRGQINATP
jgi:hypothetical protein